MILTTIRWSNFATFISAACLTFSSGAWANATGEQVVAGQAQFVRNGSDLIITQGSQRVIINWQDFSNNVGELTKFIQPNSSAAALNRVISGNPSALLGDLEANGHIYLINPNGIVVGAGANINTQSFIASTLDVADADFMSGGDLNFVGDSQKTIENLGTINGGKGDVFLIAKHVENNGTIKTEGHVGIAGGNDVLLKASGDDRIAVRVTDKDGRIDQKGLVEATKIELRTAGNNPYALAINHEGISRATSAVNKKGRIILFAEGGTTKADGTLDASAPVSGDGGFIETSGTYVKIADTVKIDTSSANGETGEWLIDPNDFTIAATGGDITAATLATQLNSNNVTIETATQGTAGGNGDIFVNEDTTWTSNNSLTLNAERNIEVNNAITNTGTGDLNLNALDGSISTGTAAITLGGGSATFTTTEAASNNTAGDRNIQIGSGGINAANTNVTLTSVDDVIVDGAINAASVTATAGDGKGGTGTGAAGERGGDISVNQTITSTLGNIQFNTGNGGIGAANDLHQPGGTGGAGGNITVNAALDAAQDILLTAGNGGQGADGIVASPGGVGGVGGNVNINAVLNAGQDMLLTAGDGGQGGGGGDAAGSPSVFNASGGGGTGGTGGNININAALNALRDISLTTGLGGGGGNGGIGNKSGSGASTQGGLAGKGGAGGNMTINAALNAGRNISLTAGNGGSGGLGGSSGGSFPGGPGGDGGAGGDISLNATLDAGQDISLTTGRGGSGGSGGVGGGGASAGPIGAVGPDGEMNGNQIDATAANGSITIDGFINPDAGGSVSLLAGTTAGQILIFTSPQDFNLTGSGSLSLQGFGFNSSNNFSTVDGDININSGDGALDLTGTVTSTNGDVTLTSGGNLSASQILTANNINLNATGSNAAIGSTGAGAIQINTTGIITANASNGSGGIFLKSPGDLNISNLNLNAGSGNAELTAEQGSLNIGTVNVTATNNVTLSTTERGTKFGLLQRPSGDVVIPETNQAITDIANITIGSGGIQAVNSNLVINSADNVSVTGDTDVTSATITAGDGVHGVIGVDLSDNFNNRVATDGTDGEQGGSVTIDGAVNTSGSLLITAGAGGNGGNGGNSTGCSVVNCVERGGDAGIAADAGNLLVNGNLTSSSGSITLTVGGAGSGGFQGTSGSSVGRSTDAAAAGNLVLNGSLAAAGDVVLNGGDGGDSPRMGTDAGQITQNAVINSSGGNVNVNLGSGGLQHGVAGQYEDGVLNGSQIDITATNGSVAINGEVDAGSNDVNLSGNTGITATDLINANNINLTAAGTDAAIGSTGAGAIQANASGIITANASTGNGGIFLSQQGDFNLEGSTINSGSGNAELTAVNGNLSTGATTFNFNGANLMLATTEDVSNNTTGDRNITIGSGGINAASTAVTFNSADDVVLNGAVQIDTANSQITGERLITSTAVGSLGNSTTSLSTSVDGLNLQGTDFYLTNDKDVTIEGVSATGEFLLDNGANDITVDGQITAQGTGDAIRLAGQKFINNAGASALNAISGRWIVWSETPVNNTFGGLQSGNAAVWNTSFNSASPTLTETGNRFAFSDAQPTGVAVVRADDKSKIYGDTFNVSDFTFSAFAADSGSSYGGAFTDPGTPGSVTLTGAPVLASLGAVNTATRTGGNGGGADYDITVDLTGVSATGFTLQGVDGLLTINQRNISVTADGINITYGNSPQAISFNATNLASFDTNASAFTGALTRTMGANSTSGNEVAGTYAITQGSLAANENYNLTGFTGNNYTIAKKSLTANTTGQNKVYDATTNATVIFGDDRIGGDVLSLNGTAEFVDANVDDINPISINVTGINLSGTDAGNYTLANTTDTTNANITKAALGVTADNINRTYDSTAFSSNVNDLSYTGFVVGETQADLGGAAIFAGSSQGAVNVGNYVISVNGLTSNNYDITFNDGQLVIDPAALNVIANNDSKVFDGVAYSGGNGVNYTGFVGGETSAVLTGTPNFSGSSQGATNPGSYVITPGGLTSNNYAINFVNGGLTINAATVGGSGNGGSGTGGGSNNTPSGTFTSFQSQQNNNVNPPSNGSNNNPFSPPPGFRFNSQGGNNFGNNSPFPLRVNLGNGAPRSMSRSSSFDNDNDE